MQFISIFRSHDFTTEDTMTMLHHISGWADRHHPKWLDVLRILLGIVLFLKGLSFITNKELVQSILSANNFEFIPVLILHWVIVFQMAHSILIGLGLLTRVAIAMQLPIVLVAIYLIASRVEFSVFSNDIWMAIFIVFLLVFFFVYGGGAFSVDGYLKRTREVEGS